MKRVPVAYTSCQHADECSQGCIESTLSALTTTPSQYCQAVSHTLLGGWNVQDTFSSRTTRLLHDIAKVRLDQTRFDQIRSWHTYSGSHHAKHPGLRPLVRPFTSKPVQLPIESSRSVSIDSSTSSSSSDRAAAIKGTTLAKHAVEINMGRLSYVIGPAGEAGCSCSC